MVRWFFLEFGLLQLARNLAIQVQTRKVFHRLFFSNSSLNASFFGGAKDRISFVTLAPAQDSKKGLTSRFLGHLSGLDNDGGLFIHSDVQVMVLPLLPRSAGF